MPGMSPFFFKKDDRPPFGEQQRFFLGRETGVAFDGLDVAGHEGQGLRCAAP